MGRVIAVASQKGGVGKTTTVLNLGFSLSRLGARVLLVDGDPQGGLGFATNVKKRAKGGVVDVLRKRIGPADAVTLSRDGALGVVSMGCAEAADVDLYEAAARDGAIAGLVSELAAGFDYTFVDAPGGVGGPTRALLAASESVLGALTCRALAMRSLPALLKALQSLGIPGRSAPRLEGLVVTMVDAAKPSEAALLARLRETLPRGTVFDTVIPADDQFELASVKSVPVAMLPNAAEAARSYMALAMELRARLTQQRNGGADDDRDLGLF